MARALRVAPFAKLIPPGPFAVVMVTLLRNTPVFVFFSFHAPTLSCQVPETLAKVAQGLFAAT